MLLSLHICNCVLLMECITNETQADDTQVNFWSNFADQLFLSNVSWALSHWEWVTNFYLDTLHRLWALSLTWLPVVGKINQSCSNQHCSKSCPVYHQPDWHNWSFISRLHEKVQIICLHMTSLLWCEMQLESRKWFFDRGIAGRN